MLYLVIAAKVAESIGGKMSDSNSDTLA